MKDMRGRAEERKKQRKGSKEGNKMRERGSSEEHIEEEKTTLRRMYEGDWRQ